MNPLPPPLRDSENVGSHGRPRDYGAEQRSYGPLANRRCQSTSPFAAFLLFVLRAVQEYGPDDPDATITPSEFRALAWAAANDKLVSWVGSLRWILDPLASETPWHAVCGLALVLYVIKRRR